MRVLISGIVGAAAAAAAWMAVEHNAKQEYGWMAVAVGLVTGIAVNWAAGAAARGSYGRGALAAVLALVACICSPQVYAKVMQNANLAPAKVAIEQVEQGEEAAVEASPDQTDEPAQRVFPLDEPAGGRSPVVGKQAFKRNRSQWTMLWLSLSALAAYVVGKGKDKAGGNEVAAETPQQVELVEGDSGQGES